MPKNIVLCADGTGNSSGALFTTNVWRLYLALDVEDPEKQVAFYHDGVGTSAFRPLALATGAVGYGLKRNVLEIYEFLCRNYQKDDRIFGFGFSRGAFTIRLLMGMVATQGIAKYTGDEAELTTDAEAAYRNFRKLFHTNTRVEDWFRRRRDDRLKREGRKLEPTGRQDLESIHFVGVWDTVDAYGGPIDEISDGIDYWIFPLSLRNLWLPAKVRRACHALALDEERQAFWPRLWNDRYVEDEHGNYFTLPDQYPVHDQKEVQEKKEQPGEPPWKPIGGAELEAIIGAPPRPTLYPLRDIDRQRLSQVWFPGVHCDVGGGYSKAGLSYVTLEWMMHRGLAYGLLINPDAEAHLRSCANELDEMNDSRRGFGTYYRYRPRKLDLLYGPPGTALCVETWNKVLTKLSTQISFFSRWISHERKPEHDEPIIHESVFNRVDAGVDYAPIVLPKSYKIARRDGRIEPGPYGSPVAAGTGSVSVEERIWNLVWYRRVMYFVTLLATVALVVILLALQPWNPGLILARWPFWLIAIVSIIIFLIFRGLTRKSSHLKANISNAMGYIWERQSPKRQRVEPTQKPWADAWPADSRRVHCLRTADLYRNFFDALRSCILPTFTVWLTPGVAAALVAFPIRTTHPLVFCVAVAYIVVLAVGLFAINFAIAWRGRRKQRGNGDGARTGVGDAPA